MFAIEAFHKIGQDSRKVAHYFSKVDRRTVIIGHLAFAEFKNTTKHVDNIIEYLNDYPFPQLTRNALLNNLSVMSAEQYTQAQTVEKHAQIVFKSPAVGRSYMRELKRRTLTNRTILLIESDRLTREIQKPR